MWGLLFVGPRTCKWLVQIICLKKLNRSFFLYLKWPQSLQVLAGCATVSESAESEGVVKHCTDTLANLWKYDGIFSHEEVFLKALPSNGYLACWPL
eukprot:m.56398 g.56398  ORF g.56398 m.56398 type:complete len:96 (+) comp34593_c0_seq1:255-542(+)